MPLGVGVNPSTDRVYVTGSGVSVIVDDADAGGSLDENMVETQQIVVIVDLRLEVVEELQAPLDPSVRKIVVDPADSDIAVGQTGAACGFEQVENHLPLAEAI